MAKTAKRVSAEPRKPVKPFWPCVLRTEPPTILTEEEVLRKVPFMTNTHIPATNPREESVGTEWAKRPD